MSIVPADRVNIDEILAEYGLTVYDPIEFIRRTHGIMYEDYEWVRFGDEKLTFTDVDIFERTGACSNKNGLTPCLCKGSQKKWFGTPPDGLILLGQLPEE